MTKYTNYFSKFSSTNFVKFFILIKRNHHRKIWNARPKYFAKIKWQNFAKNNVRSFCKFSRISILNLANEIYKLCVISPANIFVTTLLTLNHISSLCRLFLFIHYYTCVNPLVQGCGGKIFYSLSLAVWSYKIFLNVIHSNLNGDKHFFTV